MALPDLTPEQRAQALEKATQARRRRAEVKNALKARSMNLSEVLELADSDEAVAKMKVVSLLEASAPYSARLWSSVSADTGTHGTIEP